MIREKDIGDWMANWRDTSVEHMETLIDIPATPVVVQVDLRSDEEKAQPVFTLRKTRQDAGRPKKSGLDVIGC